MYKPHSVIHTETSALWYSPIKEKKHVFQECRRVGVDDFGNMKQVRFDLRPQSQNSMCFIQIALSFCDPLPRN